MRKCQNCNHENPDNAAFCENCGIKFIDNLKKCPQCQTVNTSESRFCENCGYDFQSATPKDTGNEEQLQQSNRSNAVHDLAEQQVPTSAADVTSTMANGSDNAISSAQERPQVQHAIDGKEKSQSGSESESSQGKLSSAPDGASMMTGGTPDKQRVSRLPKGVRLVSGLVIILLIGVGAYFVYGHPSASSKAPSTPAVTNKERSNVATKESGTSSSGEKHKSVNFNVTEIKKDIGATVGAIGGTNSVYVSPVNSEQSVVVNNGSQRSASSIKIYIMVTAYAMAKEG
ncbi:zinc-ribbon domain-containing protein, partial [Levilactobacillus brevis]